MSINLKNQKILYLLVFLGGIVLCSSNIWGFPIYILDEAKNAECAREMWQNNEWVVPTFNNELRTDKPPLHYYFMMLAYSIFGVSAFSARFFSAVFGAFIVLITYYFVKKLWSEKMALNTVLILLCSVFFMMVFHQAVPDPYLIFFVSFALFNFYDFYINRKWLNWFLFYSSLGFAVLSKGPIGLALPGLIVLVFLIGSKLKFMKWFKFRPFLGLLITLIICVPWFIMAHIKTNGAFTEGFFINHNINRFSSKMEGHGGIFLITWLFVLLGLLPFSFFLFQSFWVGFKDRKVNEFLRFSWIISIVWIIFFSISSTKLPNYTMPCYPFLAVLIAYYFQKKQTIKNQLGFKISLWFLVVISCLLPIGGYIALTYAEPQLRVVNYVAFSLTVVSIGAVLALFWFYKKQNKKTILAVGISYILLNFSLFYVAFPKLTSQSPVELAKQEITKETPAILYKSYDPAFLFNFQRTYPHTESIQAIKTFLETHADGVIITKKKNIDKQLKDMNLRIVLEQKSLFENYYTIILSK